MYILLDCYSGGKKRRSTPIVLSDTPAPPNKKQAVPIFYENGIAFHGIPRARHSLDLRSMRQRKQPSRSSLHVPIRNPEPLEDLTDSPHTGNEQRPSLVHRLRGSRADSLGWRPASASCNRQLDQAHLARLERVVIERTGDVKQEEMAENGPDPSQVPGFPRQLSAQDQSKANGLVSNRKECSDRLIAAYLRREYVNLPIFDLQDFKAAYEACSAGENVREELTPFHGVLSIIFSFSSLSINTSNDVELLPSFDQGRNLPRFVDYGGDRWATLQSYILQCQYFNAIGDPRMAWNLVGFALRTAQSLGLQSKTQGPDVSSRKQRELARKLWHGAILMERMISLQIGISPQTPNPSRVPLPIHLDTDYVDAISGGNPRCGVERPSMIEFFSACARLYSNVEDILAIEDEMRVRQVGCVAKKLLSLDMKTFFKTDSILYDWNISLPSFLQMGTPDGFSNDPIIHRQRNICRIRYLYIRLRLYRPLFIMGMALTANCNCKPGGTVHITGNEHNSPDSPSTLSLVRDSSIKCVVAALELINILKVHEYGQDDARLSPVPSFWENVDYLYACGIVLLAARLNPLLRNNNVDSQANMEKIETCWKNILLLLEYYDVVYRSKKTKNVAASCLRTLRMLSRAVNSPVAQTDVIAAFDDGTRTRILQRTGMDSPGPSRARASRANGSEGLTDTQSAKGQRRWSWVESLSIDLDC